MIDSQFRLEMCNYKIIRGAYGLSVPMILHLNDEMPWMPEANCPIDVIQDTYRSAPLTIRNYYYTNITNNSLYYPLGAGRVTYNKYLKANSFLDEIKVPKASKRTFVCSFAGRSAYKETHSDGATERKEFMQVIGSMQDAAGPSCYAIFSDQDKDFVANHGLDFNTYFNVMRESVFAPCPGGNNPETFRHYEVGTDGCLGMK